MSNDDSLGLRCALFILFTLGRESLRGIGAQLRY